MKKTSKMKSLWKEFKEFAIKGNAMSLAVGVIIGGAFQGIINSITNDIIMPIVSIFLGGIDFSEMKLVLPRLFGEPVVDEAGKEILNTLNYGTFLSAVINFAILAAVVFLLVKGMNKITSLAEEAEKKLLTQEEEAPAPEAPPAPSNEEVLLAKIRDLLKNK